MTTRYTPLFAAISELESRTQSPVLVESRFEFPFPQMYPGQAEILAKIKPCESFCLTSHTGFGKTPVFLSLTRGSPSIVIEPRKYLQTQVAKYYNDFVLFGRSGYTCPLAVKSYDGSKTAAMAPCLLKEDCSGTSYHDTCQKANSTCLNKPCKIFPDSGFSYRMYPCEKCEYNDAIREARRRLRSGETCIVNFGNFWNLLKDADTVVIDEADLFFREIRSAQKLRYSTPKKNSGDDIKTLLAREVSGLQKAAKDTSPKLRYAATNLLYSAQFLKDNADLCFMYQRKDSFYIEIDPRNVNILSKKLFKDKRLIIVSATPGAFELPSYSASIHQRCGIYFAPVGNLTSRSLKENPYLMSSAAKAIAEISMYMELAYDADRVVIHCGNIGTHATSLYSILGERDCVLHESGKLAETIEKYLASGKKYLLVAAASHGGDFSWASLQFILKFPFPNLDERARTLERAMGPDFKEFYDSTARTQVVQACGRVGRGFNAFGVTICLDTKCSDDYKKNMSKYPSWFQSRVDPKIY